MRVNKMTSVALVTAFAGSVALGGFSAATAVADDTPRHEIVREAPLPSAEKLTEQTELFQATGVVLTPVTDMLQAVIEAPDGRLTQEQADKHAKAVKKALAPLINADENTGKKAVKKQTRETREAREAREIQEAREAIEVNQNSAARDMVVQRDVAAPQVVTAKAAAELRAQVNALLEVSVAGEPKKVDTEAKGVVKDLVDLLKSIIEGILPTTGTQDQQQLPQQLPQR